MAEGKAGKQPPRLKWPSKVLITRGILLFIGTISVLCFAIAIARFNLYLYALRGWNNNYEQGDMFDEMVIASVRLFNALPSPSSLHLLTRNARTQISLSVLTTAVFFFHSIASPPLHPGYYVAGDVLSFVALTVCCILGFLLGPFTTYTNFVENSTCHAGPQHAFCEAEADLMQKLQIAGYSCGFLMVYVPSSLRLALCSSSWASKCLGLKAVC